MDNSSYLLHYGVKGMKWGVRRESDHQKAKRHIGIKDSGSIGLIEGKTSKQAKKAFAIRSISSILTMSATVYIATHPDQIERGERKVKRYLKKRGYGKMSYDEFGNVYSKKLGRNLTNAERWSINM